MDGNILAYEKDPNKFFLMITNLEAEVFNEIFPETGSVENLLRCYTFKEAYNTWLQWYVFKKNKTEE